jgi:histone-binding protein RBBP4
MTMFCCLFLQFLYLVQIWRMSDLIYRPEEEVLTELEAFKTHLASCTPRT